MHIFQETPQTLYFEKRTTDKPWQALVLHSDTGNLENTKSILRGQTPRRVSCHFSIDPNGTVEDYGLINQRAWHAGVSAWAGYKDTNSIALGIEFLCPNQDYDFTKVALTEAQKEAGIKLCRQLITQFNIPLHHVVGHQDIAPNRKVDPGLWFPWQSFAAQGVGLWHDQVSSPDEDADPLLEPSVVELFWSNLAGFGYGVSVYERAVVLNAFRAHYDPCRALCLRCEGDPIDLTNIAPPTQRDRAILGDLLTKAGLSSPHCL
jgi:N-acetylmuramoyl-L-alanine amidase